MIKLTIFIVTLLTLSVTDILIMKKENLKKEMVPYLIIAAAALFAAITIFTDPFRGSVIDLSMGLLRVTG